MSEVERRLREWAECIEVHDINLYGETNILYRIMREGPASASVALRRGGGNVLRMVQQYSHALRQDSERREVSAAVAQMPTQYMAVVEQEYITRHGYRKACRELNWSGKRWWETRAAMLSWLAQKLELPAYEP